MGYYGFLVIESIHTVFTLIYKFKLKNESKREHLTNLILGRFSQMNYKPGSVIKTYHLSRLKITLKLKQLTLMTSQGWLLVFTQCHLYLVLLPVGFSSVHCYQ